MRTPGEAHNALGRLAIDRTSKTFKRLLEEKHLYQSLEVAIDEEVQAIASKLIKPSADNFRIAASQYLARLWYVVSPGSGTAQSGFVEVTVLDIHTFCKRCDRVQPFNLLQGSDALGYAPNPIDHGFVDGLSRVQNFVLSYMCQGCKRGTSLRLAPFVLFVFWVSGDYLSILVRAIRGEEPRSAHAAGQPFFEAKCAEPLPVFTLGEKSRPTSEQVAALCSCIWNNLGSWERDVSQKIAKGQERDVSELQVRAFVSRFGSAIEKCGGMKL